jgi:hypothetical protein
VLRRHGRDAVKLCECFDRATLTGSAQVSTSQRPIILRVGCMAMAEVMAASARTRT